MTFPHCDPRVVHSPESGCEYCGESGLQEVRAAWGIAFTGESDRHPELIRCPAEQARPVSTIHLWGGNRPGGWDSVEPAAARSLRQRMMDYLRG